MAGPLSSDPSAPFSPRADGWRSPLSLVETLLLAVVVIAVAATLLSSKIEPTGRASASEADVRVAAAGLYRAARADSAGRKPRGTWAEDATLAAVLSKATKLPVGVGGTPPRGGYGVCASSDRYTLRLVARTGDDRAYTLTAHASQAADGRYTVLRGSCEGVDPQATLPQ